MAAPAVVYKTVSATNFDEKALRLEKGARDGTHYLVGPDGERLRFKLTGVTFVWGKDAPYRGEGPSTAVLEVDQASVQMLEALWKWAMGKSAKMHAARKGRRSNPKPLFKFGKVRVKLAASAAEAPIKQGSCAGSVSTGALLWSPAKPDDKFEVTESLSLTAYFVNDLDEEMTDA